MNENLPHVELHTAVSRKDLAAMDRCLAAGAKPDWFDQATSQPTALQEAAGLNFVRGLEKLVAAGGDVNAIGAESCTPLTYAAKLGRVEAGRSGSKRVVG